MKKVASSAAQINMCVSNYDTVVLQYVVLYAITLNIKNYQVSTQ